MTTLVSSCLTQLGIHPQSDPKFQLPVAELIEQAVKLGEATLASSGALSFNTGEFTGRSPGSRFIVRDEKTSLHVDWNSVNKPMDPDMFSTLLNRVSEYLSTSNLYVRLAKACHHPSYEQSILTLTEQACQDIFVHNMFLRCDPAQITRIDWKVLVASNLKITDYKALGLPTAHCVALDFSSKTILVIGTAYTGEIKKGIFSALNYLLPLEHKVLTMHCSANVGNQQGDTALFFGLSGTGKTTLSSDVGRRLIGDDEHGWAEDTVFNFEGGCYAKTIDLSEKSEPDIYQAIRFGALVENMQFEKGSRNLNFKDDSLTENIRASYPIYHLSEVEKKGMGKAPEHIFFLSADAFGTLPPISKLTPDQAMYYFLNGYTAKVAGTEVGVKTPTATFSACFGAAFLPLAPMQYARMLGDRLEKNPNIHVWLVNTGWIAGPYGVGRRIPLIYTRRLIRAALDGSIHEGGYEHHEPFGLRIPKECSGVPDAVLNPARIWDNPEAYQQMAEKLKGMFEENYKQFSSEPALLEAE